MECERLLYSLFTFKKIISNSKAVDNIKISIRLHPVRQRTQIKFFIDKSQVQPVGLYQVFKREHSLLLKFSILLDFKFFYYLFLLERRRFHVSLGLFVLGCSHVLHGNNKIFFPTLFIYLLIH